MARTPMKVDTSDLRPTLDVATHEALVDINEAVEAEGGSMTTGQPPNDLTALDHVEGQPAPPKYDRWMRPERPVERESGGVDDQTGWRYEWRSIGMVRNAGDESRRRMVVYLDPIPHVVLDQNVPLRGWYQSRYEPKAVRPRPCETDAILTQPYGGYCSVGCAFCYINAGIRGYRGQGVTVVDPSYPDKVGKQLTKMRTAAAVYMSSFIDPFLEVEDYYHNTQRTAYAAIQAGLPIFFLTRKQPPGWAFDYLKQNPHSYMQFSINTSNAEDWRRLSPQAIPLDQQIENVREMHRQGIYVSIQVNPIVAGVVSDDDIIALIHRLAEAGANHLIFKYVEITYPAVNDLKRQIRARFPERADAFDQLFNQNIGGFRTIDEEYRKAGHDKFLRETRKAGVTMGLCYEYEYARDAEGKVTSKTGVTIGHKYLTGDQCHGHRVPVYSRPTTSVPFEPIEACPPSGCLRCVPEGQEKEAPCGNELLARAPAWDSVMLNEPADTARHGGDPKKLLKRLKVLGSGAVTPCSP